MDDIKGKIVSNPPQFRCHECGSRDLHGLCVRCHAPGCHEHIYRLHKPPLEFTDLSLKEDEERPFHCGREECKRYTPVGDPRWGGTSLAVLSLGVVLITWTTQDGLGTLLTLLGAASGGVWAYLRQKRRSSLRRNPPVLPLSLHLNSVELVETIHGRIEQDRRGSYSITRGKPSGRVNVRAQRTKANAETWEAYQSKFAIGGQEADFRAGFLLLSGKLNVAAAPTSPDTFPVILLSGELDLQGDPAREVGTARGSWTPHYPYDIARQVAAPEFPVRVVAALIQDSGRRKLEFQVQWNPLHEDDGKARAERINSLRINFPAAWGNMRVHDAVGESSHHVDNHTACATRSLVLHDLSLDSTDKACGAKTFSATFDEEIDLAANISGHVHMQFADTLSELAGVTIFDPLGGRRSNVKVECCTVVEADFDLSLGALRWQEVRSFPEEGVGGNLSFEGLRPDDRTVWELARVLSESFYVKTVFESPMQPTEKPSEVSRRWDLTGRHYNGICPIDFELRVGGTHPKNPLARIGVTEVTMNARGAYANPDMEEAIRETWQRLQYQTKATLNNLRSRS